MILVIDNYDSFTWNLVQALNGLGAETLVLQNDKVGLNQIRNLSPHGLVISPGPGRPENAGNCLPIIQEFYNTVPILGVCLGHQCIGVAFGQTVRQSHEIVHGRSSLISHNGSFLFQELSNPFYAARYHSLSLNGIPDNFQLTAWVEDDEIMAMEHLILPIFGVQFHPESFMTHEGKKLLQKFLDVC